MESVSEKGNELNAGNEKNTATDEFCSPKREWREIRRWMSGNETRIKSRHMELSYETSVSNKKTTEKSWKIKPVRKETS